jgi:phospholipid-binding lipoprotein MlaA
MVACRVLSYRYLQRSWASVPALTLRAALLGEGPRVAQYQTPATDENRDMRYVKCLAQRAIAWALLVLVSACAGTPRDPSLPISDPNEQTNRKVLADNQTVLRPISEVVKAVIPGPVHDRLHDFNSNLKEPRIFVNDVLQFRFEAAAHTSTRFLANSVFGIGGFFDIASREGVPQESGDFGQTLFVWGISEGPYVVRPYFGPSTLRDSVGSIVDMIGNPLGWVVGAEVAETTDVAITVGTTSLDAADKLGQLKAAEDASIDFYSFIRSSYYQTRRAELREALGLPNVVESPAISDIGDSTADAGNLAKPPR